MSEKLFKFLLSELNTIRIKCVGCHAVIELPANKFQSVSTCPACGAVFQPGGPTSGSAFWCLSEAIRLFHNAKNAVEIEFVIPDKS